MPQAADVPVVLAGFEQTANDILVEHGHATVVFGKHLGKDRRELRGQNHVAHAD